MKRLDTFLRQGRLHQEPIIQQTISQGLGWELYFLPKPQRQRRPRGENHPKSKKGEHTPQSRSGELGQWAQKGDYAKGVIE